MAGEWHHLQGAERPFIVIGNAGNKRTLWLQEARRKLGMAPAVVLTYKELLAEGLRLDDVLHEQHKRWRQKEELPFRPIIRLDAPGEEPLVERALIARGAEEKSDNDTYSSAYTGIEAGGIPAADALDLPIEHGRLLYPAQWYRGFSRLLASLQADADRTGIAAQWVNRPSAVAAMFDKRASWRLMSEHGVSVPPLPAPPGSIAGYESLRAAIKNSGMHRLFIKLACGSGAAGIIAYQSNPRTGEELATTTIGVEEQDGKTFFYNAGKLRRYRDHSTIRLIVDWVCREGAHVERWIEKEGMGGKSFDVRQLVVNGEACHTVLRLSATPITNLHLRNERITVTGGELPDETALAVKRTAEKALAAFEGAGTAGIDVLISRGGRGAYAIDVNPFGDLLYDVLYRGDNTYEWQMRQLLGGKSLPC